MDGLVWGGKSIYSLFHVSSLGWRCLVLTEANPLNWISIRCGPIFLSLSISIVGALIVIKQPGNLMGWIYTAVGFFQGFSWFSYPYAVYALITEPGSFARGEPDVGVIRVYLGTGVKYLIDVAILLYPTGRLPSPRWRIVAWLSLAPPLFTLLASYLLLPYGGKAMLLSQNIAARRVCQQPELVDNRLLT